MATHIAATDTATTIHKQIEIRQNYLLAIPLLDMKRFAIEKEIKELKRELNRINYEVSLQTSS